jgi:hypothetical protein
MALDPDEIERLRENSHIHLDGDGRFWHEGALVEHPRIALAFHRGLERAPDGRPALRIGRTWCYITADSTLYIARAALCTEGSAGALAVCRVRLDDETEEDVPLANGCVRIDPEGVLYVRVKEGREWARLRPAAQGALGVWVEQSGDGWALKTSGGMIPIASIDHAALLRPA